MLCYPIVQIFGCSDSSFTAYGLVVAMNISVVAIVINIAIIDIIHKLKMNKSILDQAKSCMFVSALFVLGCVVAFIPEAPIPLRSFFSFAIPSCGTLYTLANLDGSSLFCRN